MPDCRIGVDESGKGDFFGPLVVAACYVGPEHLAELENVRESKKVSDAVAGRLAAQIRKTCPHTVISIGPAKYNELYDKIQNLNRLLAWGHARAIENLLEQQECDLVISDQFADPAGLKRALFEKGRQITLESRVRAEDDVAVASASILARAEFLRRLKYLGEDVGVTLPKGASPAVVETAKSLVRRYGEEVLTKVAKTHFKTYQQVVAVAP